MRYVGLLVRLLVWGYCATLFLFLLTSYHPEAGGFRPPFGIFLLDTINLFIHEAGHLFFKLFGMWLHIVAGSLVQVLIPLALLVVTWRQTISQIGFPGFWLGESMINVSAYIKDAPVRQLRLIAKGLIHDWNWLLSDNLEAAEPLGEIVFLLGALVCGASIGAGVFFAIRTFRHGVPPPPEE